MLFLMGTCWWIALSYDCIFLNVRECAELRRKIDAARKNHSKDGTGEEMIEELTGAWASAAGRANHRMCNTISGRIVARVFNFQTLEIPEE
ncbi:MAG: hypothetical protein RQ767_05080 [Thermovirgaceae bacterium]|nr:hypothetical protein [Thermovirgaceae bacterium]